MTIRPNAASTNGSVESDPVGGSAFGGVVVGGTWATTVTEAAELLFAGVGSGVVADTDARLSTMHAAECARQ